MRLPILSLAFLTACAGAPAAPKAARPLPQTGKIRIVYRQYRRGSTIFVMESLAGRDLKKLRSRPLRAGEHPVAYVPDDVMRRLLEEFDRFGFQRYARPRPANPLKFGASGELTLIEPHGRTRSMLRIKLKPGQKATRAHIDRSRAYVNCAKTFLAVWNAYPPLMQVAATGTGTGGFGVHRADVG